MKLITYLNGHDKFPWLISCSWSANNNDAEIFVNYEYEEPEYFVNLIKDILEAEWGGGQSTFSSHQMTWTMDPQLHLKLGPVQRQLEGLLFLVPHYLKYPGFRNNGVTTPPPKSDTLPNPQNSFLLSVHAMRIQPFWTCRGLSHSHAA